MLQSSFSASCILPQKALFYIFSRLGKHLLTDPVFGTTIKITIKIIVIIKRREG